MALQALRRLHHRRPVRGDIGNVRLAASTLEGASKDLVQPSALGRVAMTDANTQIEMKSSTGREG